MLGGRRLVCKYVYRYCIVLVDSFLFFLSLFLCGGGAGLRYLQGVHVLYYIVLPVWR